jgi:hypothetical protein
MGNCCPKQQNISNEPIVNKEGNISKICKENEISFWEEMQKTKLIKLARLTKKNVEFNYSNLYFENYVSFSQMLEQLVEEENYFYFIPIFEVVLAIIDFLQLTLYYKEKHGLNYFFLINFDKFYLEKTNSKYYSRPVYLDSKLCEIYTTPEIIIKEDNNLLSSFSVVELNPNSHSNSQSNEHTTNSPNQTSALDANSYFYSKCNERYQKLRANFSLEKCEIFYAECILTFFTKFLLKKTSMASMSNDLEHDFTNFKYIYRKTVSDFYKAESKNLNLKQLKYLLMNFYLNNQEFAILQSKLNNLLTDEFNQDRHLMDKVISYKRADIDLVHGDCDIESEPSHKIVFLYDKVENKEEYSFCCSCVKNIIFKRAPEGRDDMIQLAKFEELLLKKANLNLSNYFNYFCFNPSLESKKEFVNVYKKNKNNLTFEVVEWDEYMETVINNEVLNLDFIAKTKVERVSNKKKLIPNK